MKAKLIPLLFFIFLAVFPFSFADFNDEVEAEIIDNQTKFPNLKTKEDFVLWLKILQKNISINYFNETLSSWRKLDNSLSSSVIQKLIDAFKVYNYYMKFNFIKSFYYTICLSINNLKIRLKKRRNLNYPGNCWVSSE